MNPATLPTVAAGSVVTAALLKIAGLNLALPQGEIRAVEAAIDVDMAGTGPRSIGWIMYAQQRWPVYCLSEELALLSHVPVERRDCVLLPWGAGYVGVLCDEVSIAKQLPARRYAVPAAMALPNAPIQYLIAYDGGMVCGSDAQKLAAHIVRLAAR